MSHSFSFRWTEAVYIEANQLHFWLTVRSRKMVTIVTWLIGLYFCVGLITEYYIERTLSLYNAAHYLGLAIAVSFGMLTICYGIGYATLGRRSRKLFEQQKLMHFDTHFEVTDTAFMWSNEMHQGKLPYDMAFKWAENSKIFLIYHSDNSFQLLSKNEVSTTIVDQLRANLMVAGCPGRSI